MKYNITLPNITYCFLTETGEKIDCVARSEKEAKKRLEMCSQHNLESLANSEVKRAIFFGCKDILVRKDYYYKERHQRSDIKKIKV